MAFGRSILILAGNLNSGHRYLITAVTFFLVKVPGRICDWPTTKRRTLIINTFWSFWVWSTLLSQITTNFWRAPINPNQFCWKNNWCIIYQCTAVGISLLPVDCLALNPTTVIMLINTHKIICERKLLPISLQQK